MASGVITGSYRGYHLRSEWSSTPNTAGNYSDITVRHKLVCDKQYDLYIGSRTNSCTVNGETKNFTSSSISTTGNTTINLGTTTYRVYHNADGKKSTSLSTIFNLKATITGVYVEKITASGTITLDNIPRDFTQTPKVIFQSATTTSATFRWETSETCDYVGYVLDGGAGVKIFEGSATSGTFTVNGLEPNSTHDIYIWARRKDSQRGMNSSHISFTTSSKTMRLKMNGTWKDGTPYIKVNGVWKVAVPYIKINGSWKRCS